MWFFHGQRDQWYQCLREVLSSQTFLPFFIFSCAISLALGVNYLFNTFNISILFKTSQALLALFIKITISIVSLKNFPVNKLAFIFICGNLNYRFLFIQNHNRGGNKMKQECKVIGIGTDESCKGKPFNAGYLQEAINRVLESGKWKLLSVFATDPCGCVAIFVRDIPEPSHMAHG